MKVYIEKILSTTRELSGICEGDRFSLRPITYQNSHIFTEYVKDDRFFRKYLLLSLTYENGLNKKDNESEYILQHKVAIDTFSLKGYNQSINNTLRNFLCLHFGKLIIDHGTVRFNEYTHLPRDIGYNPIKNIDSMCCNKSARKEFEYGDNLANCKERVDKFIRLLKNNDDSIVSFLKSMDLYYNAVCYLNTNETISFLLFISAIETLLKHFCEMTIEDHSNSNKEIVDNFKIIDNYITNLKDNKKVKNFILKHIYGVKAKFICIIHQYINSEFDFGYELFDDEEVLLDYSDRNKLFGEIYDIRSDYLHSGGDIDDIVTSPFTINDTPIDSPSFLHIDSPLFLMERIVRYILNSIFENYDY